MIPPFLSNLLFSRVNQLSYLHGDRTQNLTLCCSYSLNIIINYSYLSDSYNTEAFLCWALYHQPPGNEGAFVLSLSVHFETCWLLHNLCMQHHSHYENNCLYDVQAITLQSSICSLRLCKWMYTLESHSFTA